MPAALRYLFKATGVTVKATPVACFTVLRKCRRCFVSYVTALQAAYKGSLIKPSILTDTGADKDSNEAPINSFLFALLTIPQKSR